MKHVLIAAAAATVLCGADASAQPVSIIDTFGPNNSVSSSGFGLQDADDRLAFSFFAPRSPEVAITQIQIQCGRGNFPQTVMYLVPDLGGLPAAGNVLTTITLPARTFEESGFVVSSPAAAVPLDAGDRYWLIWTGGRLQFSESLRPGLEGLASFDLGPWTGVGRYPGMRILGESHGACCSVLTGQCTLTLPSHCAGAGLEFRGRGVVCTPANCPAAVGACCVSSVTPRCELHTAAACASLSGVYFGDRTVCLPATPGEPNRCCVTDFNNSGSVSVQDIFDFLAAYFSGCP